MQRDNYVEYLQSAVHFHPQTISQHQHVTLIYFDMKDLHN